MNSKLPSSTLNLLKRLRAPASLTEVVGRGGNIDSHVARAENVLHQLHAENLLAEATADFKHAKYRDGHEDAMTAPPDFAFFKKHIKDPRIVDLYQKAYNSVQEDLANRKLALPEEFQQYEEFAKKVTAEHESRQKDLLEFARPEDMAADGERFRKVRENVSTWTAAEFVENMPGYGEKLQEDWDNQEWTARDDHP